MPEGTNDVGDQDTTPAGAIDFDSGEPKRHTVGDVPGVGDPGRERLRVQSMLVGTDGNPAVDEPDVQTIAANAAVADNGTTVALVFNIETGAGLLGATVLSGLPRASRFGIHGLIHTAGVGRIQLQYRINDAGAWQFYENYPLSLNYPIDEVLIPTAQQYRVFYFDINDGAGTTGLDLQVVLYPTPA